MIWLIRTPKDSWCYALKTGVVQVSKEESSRMSIDF